MRPARTISLAVCLALGFTSQRAASEDYPQVWLNPGFLSYHADRSKDYREDNIGLGVEAVFAPDHGFFAGNFINSDNFRSYYVMYQWRPLHWQLQHFSVSGGLIAGFLDGYPKNRDGGWFFGALPALFFEGERFGVNLLIVPASDPDHRLVAIQLKLRVR
jgi:hypothetical protein